MKSQRSSQKGFTLIELMIVVAIIGILAAVGIPQYQKYVTKSTATSIITTSTREFHTAILEHAARFAQLPQSYANLCDNVGFCTAAGAAYDGTTAAAEAGPDVTGLDYAVVTAAAVGTLHDSTLTVTLAGTGNIELDGQTVIVTYTMDANGNTAMAVTGGSVRAAFRPAL